MKKVYLLLIHLIPLSAAFSQTNNGVTSYSCPLSPLGGLAKRSTFVVDNAGNKWIGFASGNTSSAVLVRYDGVKWISFAHDFTLPIQVYSLAVDSGKTLWVGTNAGLYRFYDTTKVGFYSGTYLSLACGDGNLYGGTNSGLVVINNSGTTIFTHTSNGLASDTILSIAYENSTSIWLGNPKGLDKFDGVGIFAFSTVQPSQTDSVMCIYIDGSNNKWLGTNHHGVIRYDNTNFNTMPQLYGTPLGINWPVKTYSIGKGPNGGVFFSNLYRQVSPPILSCSTPGSIEIIGSQIKSYAWTAFSSQIVPGAYDYPAFGYDPIANQLFYAEISIPGTYLFLYSFDPSMYTWPTMTQNNSDFLDINNVQALITSNDDMGWDLEGTKYFVPKGSSSSPLRTTALWMGGYHNGMLEVGAVTYRQNGVDFWPGPLDPATDSTDQATSAAYDKVWKVDRYDIANFIYNWNAGTVQTGSFVPSPGILNWPGNNAHPLAPFVDVNGDGAYDPMSAGDYPIIKGDQMIWWVFNDVLSHKETGGAKIGVQVNASAYAFVCPNMADSNRALNYTTFYNYKIVNFSPNVLDSFYVSPWIDADLGNYADDYIQCDVANNYGFIFNGDNFDEDANGLTGYHSNLPVFSCNILSGPMADSNDGLDNDNDGIVDEVSERCMMHTFTYYTNTLGPRTNYPADYYNIMSAGWRNGTPITYGGNGINPGSTEICHHVFPGISDPYGVSLGGTAASPHSPVGSFGTCGWTQPQSGLAKGDMRFIIGVGPFTMQPGGTYELDYALVFSQDSTAADTGCAHTLALADNIRVKRWFDTNSFPSCLSLAGVGMKENATSAVDVKVYPNPATEQLFVEFSEMQGRITVEVLDVVGNVIKGAVFTDARKYAAIPVSDLPNGLYMLRVKTVAGSVTKKFVKQ